MIKLADLMEKLAFFSVILNYEVHEQSSDESLTFYYA